MKENLIQNWKQDKLYTALVGCWLATVFSSFFGAYLFPVTVPIVGTMFAFRILLPVTIVLYLIWAKREGTSLWRGVSTLEKWCDIFGAVLLLYGAVSLFRAIELSWTFRRLFNLTYDVCFFWLGIRMLQISSARKWTMRLCTAMLGLLILLGVYELFFGGIVNSFYDSLKRVYIFNDICQFPIVFSGNTNDYSATLLFLFAAIMLWWLRPENTVGRGKAVILAILGVFCYAMPLTANARLCEVSSVILLAGFVLYLLIAKRKGRFLIPVILIVGILFVEFSNRYYYLMPQIEAYVQSFQSDEPGSGGSSGIQLGRPGQQSLQDEFWETDAETGEMHLREEGSAGVRTRLLIHSGRCFAESYGLGVGLGNTEILARERAVTQNGIWSIHCFIARLLADYGIFALIPLGAIVWLLLKEIFGWLKHSIKCRDRKAFAYGVLSFAAVLIYPFVSTASSDAQDLLAMWVYLAAVVSFIGRSEECSTDLQLKP